MIYKRLRRIDRSDRIVRTEHPKGKAFSADDWLIGVVVAACFTGMGLHGVVFHELYMGLGQRKEWHSDHSYHGYTWTGQAAVVFGIIFIAFGLLGSTKIIFANNLSRRWRIIHFLTSVVIAAFFFSVGGQRPWSYVPVWSGRETYWIPEDHRNWSHMSTTPCVLYEEEWQPCDTFMCPVCLIWKLS